MDWKTTRFTARIPGFRGLTGIRDEVMQVCNKLYQFRTQQHDAFFPVDIFVDGKSAMIMHKDMYTVFGLSDNKQLMNYAVQKTKMLIASYYDQYIAKDKSELYPHLTDLDKRIVLDSMESLFRALDDLSPTQQLIDQSIARSIAYEIGDVWAQGGRVDLNTAEMFVFNMGSIDALNSIHTQLKLLWNVVARNSIDGIGRYTDDVSYVLVYLALVFADSNPGVFIDTEEGVSYEPLTF